MIEEELYDPIGKWLIKNKGCQQDEYSQGYLKDVKVGNVRPDILAIRYEVKTDQSVPVIDFHGYVVEVKSDEHGVNELIGKVVRTKKWVKEGDPSKEWSTGFHWVSFYIAYPTDKIPFEIFKMCKNDGVGVLRLQITDDGKVNVYEELKPEEIQLGGISHTKQRSPGNFKERMNGINHLKQMFQRPEKLYEDFIRPGKDKYDENRKLNQNLSHVKNKDSMKARDHLINRIKSEFPQIKMVPKGGKISFELPESEGSLLLIEPTTGYFYMSIGDRRYRVYSQSKILDIKSGEEYEGDLDNLISNEIIPT
ncbi:MAG: hypothetical protein ACOC5L_04170 [Halobacteriota archaeon]